MDWMVKLGLLTLMLGLTARADQAADSSCSSCLDLHLGSHNLFLLEDYAGGGTVEGKVAAGGKITLTGFSVGMRLPDGDVSNTLVAGGDLILSNGGVSGDAWHGGSYNASGVEYRHGVVRQGTPIDFVARFTELRELSERLANRQANGATRRENWGGVMMSGTDPCLNVFEVNASSFIGARLWSIAAPASSFVVVNIRGTPPTYSGFGISLNGGITPRRVLYNFKDATSITARGFRFPGTVLAPHARVTFNEGSWEGSLYAVALTGNATGSLNPLDEVDGGGDCEEGSTAPCTTSCGSTGTRVCNATCTWGACVPPEVEACNGVDDNCDRRVDEGFECTGSSSRNCMAWCGEEGTQTCNPGTCSYGTCVSSSCCHADADCQGGAYCEGNVCVAKKSNGASCGSATQCASGQCVDGVCCNTACSGACDSCALPGSMGSCIPSPSESEGLPSCAPYVCSGDQAICPVMCVLDSHCASGSYCNGGMCEEKNANGNSCSGASQCASGQCVDGVCCNSVCEGECAACNLPGSMGTCSFTPPTAECRASGGTCDVAEYCTGSSASCPADGKAPSGTECNDGNACTTGDVCDGAGTCAGTQSVTCPPTSYGSWSDCGGFSDTCDTTGTQSRTVTTYTYNCATRLCDATTGTETRSCTVDTSGVQCRGATGACDVAEYCSDGACPADGFASSSTVCRTSGGTCDAAEYCTGSSASCPADAKQPSTTACRDALGLCDAAEYCTGTSNTCPTDAKQPSTTTCRASVGVCDAAEYCTGTSNTCPADGFASSTTMCRAASGSCDVAEKCTGTSSTCPTDAKEPSTTVCRASNGDCDVAEKCTGTSNTCPADGFASSTTVCRAASGNCDVAEKCTGTSSTCPTDAKAIAGAPCNDGNACTTGDVCDGAGTCAGTQSVTCPPTSYGSWSTCGGFSSTCDTTGTQSRTVKHYTYNCATHLCDESTSTETRSCTIDTSGKNCGQNYFWCSGNDLMYKKYFCKSGACTYINELAYPCPEHCETNGTESSNECW
jgi:choice-of-anchor A domain-containing protein